MIFHRAMPAYPWMEPSLAKLPGVRPLEGGFLHVDEAFAGQMALRDNLIANRRDAVHALRPEARAAADELYALVLENISKTDGYIVSGSRVTRPDGVQVALDPAAPLAVLGRLVQEDLCILQSDGAEHVLTGAILCFPASWTLVQKIGRPMGAIHTPVAGYAGDLQRRVQRMMDMIRPEQGLWRMNYLTYASADLHHPRLEEAPRDRRKTIEKPFVRCEKQCLIRLPKTGAVVFSIHTYLMKISDLPTNARESLMKIAE